VKASNFLYLPIHTGLKKPEILWRLEICNLTAIVDIPLGDGRQLPAAIMEDVFSGIAKGRFA
jgi:hypothetical protein